MWSETRKPRSLGPMQAWEPDSGRSDRQAMGERIGTAARTGSERVVEPAVPGSASVRHRSNQVYKEMKVQLARLGSDSSSQSLMNQALARAGGAPLVRGNAVRILRDAGQHYSSWISAIEAAEHHVHFENYIISDDEVGRRFIEVLAKKAREGIVVRLLYDWMGSIGTGQRLWKPLLHAGGMVRHFNRPGLASPVAWLSRDHRKTLTVDSRIGFVSGLCVSRKWLGDAAKGVPPWRDTGIEVRGPAVADIEKAFAQMWALSGSSLVETGSPIPEPVAGHATEEALEGDVGMRVIAAVPNAAGLYRLDQLIAVMASRTLWLTDAYFLGVAPYVQALCAAARDNVDVRLLVPGTSDLALLSSVSRAGYRPLLEAGVRVFEWNGSMLHAKTAVSDGRWARIGSSNLNLASWIGNYELDVAVEDGDFARSMERMYEDDLRNATEIVLDERRRICPAYRSARTGEVPARGSASRTTAGLVRYCRAVSAIFGDQRSLEEAEFKVLVPAALALLALAVIIMMWPYAVVLPLALLASWFGISLLLGMRRSRATERRRAG